MKGRGVETRLKLLISFAPNLPKESFLFLANAINRNYFCFVFRLRFVKAKKKLNLSQFDFHHLSKASSVFMKRLTSQCITFQPWSIRNYIHFNGGKKRYINVALKFMLQCRRNEREAAVNSAEDRVENFFFHGKTIKFMLQYENYINLILL